MKKLKLNLLENCFSFLNESLKKASEAEKNSKEWKFCILFLVQSIELALKEVLRREHPLLIYKNPEFQTDTVTIDIALKRILNIPKISLSKSDVDKIIEAKKIRNRIVHHEIDEETEAVKVIFSSLIAFVNEFISINLKEEIHYHFERGLWNNVLSITEHVQEVTKRAKETIKKENIKVEFIWNCPKCYEDTFILDVKKEAGECLICHYTDDIVECDSCGMELFSENSFSFHPYADESYCYDCHSAYIEDAYTDLNQPY